MITKPKILFIATVLTLSVSCHASVIGDISGFDYQSRMDIISKRANNVFNNSDVYLNVGVWSAYRGDATNGMTGFHKGMGLDWNFNKSLDGVHGFSASFWNSNGIYGYEDHSLSLTYSFSPIIGNKYLDKVSYNISASWLNNVVREWSSSRHETVGHHRESNLTFVPSITVHPCKYFNLSFYYLPEMNRGASPEMFMVKGGINLTEFVNVLEKQ